MTGMEPSAGPERRPTAPTVSTKAMEGRGEVQFEQGNLVLTFHLPELRPDELDYRVGARTVSLWSKRPGVEFRTIVVLPVWVRPDEFIMTHKNGIYEFHMTPHAAATLPAA